jgi:phosphatidylglycerophosphate synthase
MQVVIPLPPVGEIEKLDTPVCGVPLLVRVIAAALRSGGSKFLLLLPRGLPRRWLALRLRSRAIGSACIETLEIGGVFDPHSPKDWHGIAHCLDDRFLWMPYDYIVHRTALTSLLATAASHPGAAVQFAETAPFERPAVLLKSDLLEGTPGRLQAAIVDGQPGVFLRPPASLEQVEAELVRRSGKATDGIYSRFNRKLCRPAVRWLSHTAVTPNAVTFAGLAVAVFAALSFARGSWLWNVAGAALFFLSGLCDEIDGMLARLKFQESPFGCWLETMVDYSTYLLIFAGMTVGGYRRGGALYVALGAALLFGCVLSFFTISVQRRLAAPADRPNEYSQNYLAALDRDSRNPISFSVRQLQFLLKKGVLVHYLLLFALLNLLPLILFLGAFGANVAWIVTVYFNRRLFLPHKGSNRRPATGARVPAEVAR